ncbi:MAG: hypothetical protein IJM27_10570 [Eubacterium sp.]|nr:hypothetical protein [Eubacterium sp.]
MKKMDAMYICTTPFQVMSAISLVVDREEKADLYIDPQFEGAAEMAERIRQRKIFDTVKVLDKVKAIRYVRGADSTLQRYRRIFALYHQIDVVAGEILIPDRSYTAMYATHNVFIANLVMVYFSKFEIKTRIYFFDDGEGSYDNRDIFKISRGDQLSKRIILKGKRMYKPRRYYMYSPHLFSNMHPTNVTPVYSLPNFNKHPEVKEHLAAVFEITEEKGIKEPVIILDALKEVVLSPSDDEKIVKLYDRLQEEFGADRVIVKRHPRDKRTYENPIKEYAYKNMPFECICLASDPGKMTLITLLSTSTIMPKLLMDEEPRIVLLYHLFKRLEGDDEDRDRFFEMTKETYRDPSRICIPNTEEELDEVIRTIKAELQQ